MLVKNNSLVFGMSVAECFLFKLKDAVITGFADSNNLNHVV